ncbi:MAG: hypothetical protein QOD39_450, partial [Mycobacterium sp.]|nr:hypothetical protein [Mycobacterium sp.]
MTSTGIGWVLRDEPGVDATVPDHDPFDVASDVASDFVPEVATDDDISQHTSAVRSAQAIAASSGRQVNSVRVTWSDDAAGKAPLLLKSLRDLGFDHIDPVKLKEAIRTWALAFGRTLGFEKCAVCLVEATSVTVLAVGYGTVRTAAVTHMPDRADDLSRWLTEVFENNSLHPDGLFLVGAHDELEPIATSLKAVLSMPVVAQDDCRLALARGALFATLPRLEIINATAGQQTSAKPGDRFEQTRMWSPKMLAHEVSVQPHVWAAAALAVCAVAGAIASFAFAPEFTGHSESRPTVNRPASNSASSSDSSAASDPAATAANIHAVPSSVVPRSAPVVQLRAGKPAVAPQSYPAPPPAGGSQPLPQVSAGYEEVAAAPTTAQPIVQQAPTPVRPGGASAPPGGGTPHWPFPSPPSTGEDPTDDPIGDPDGGDPGGGQDDPGGGQDNPGGGQDNPGGGQDNPGGGQDNPGGGQDN